MLLSGYTMKLVRAAECKPGRAPLYCIAALNDDITEVLPYLNTELEARGMHRDPPALLVDYEGRQIVLEGRRIEISDIRDGVEATGVLDALAATINDIWERRDKIAPSFETKKSPQVIEVYRMLPGKNCAACGERTCMAFAVTLVKRGAVIRECTELSAKQAQDLSDYLR
jgi:ArsR family metal-binding transcriptional regulator